MEESSQLKQLVTKNHIEATEWVRGPFPPLALYAAYLHLYSVCLDLHQTGMEYDPLMIWPGLRKSVCLKKKKCKMQQYISFISHFLATQNHQDSWCLYNDHVHYKQTPKVI